MHSTQREKESRGGRERERMVTNEQRREEMDGLCIWVGSRE